MCSTGLRYEISCYIVTHLQIKLTSKYKPIVCALNNYNLNSRKNCEPGPVFEPRTSKAQNIGLYLLVNLILKYHNK